ncbi:MAG: TetR/AcrR family transcriptional regulator [Acidimicrobiales bacterium]|nr:TetR/AcrR family transcriptional regulator [Acidimicrobiales bacterium]
MPASPDRSGAETRRAIIDTAARVFRNKGYETATLGEIAEELGITRSAVLHHFESKEALLAEVLIPLVAAMDGLLDRREAAGRLTPRTRRPFLVELVDIICDHPDAAAIAAFDASIRHRMDAGHQIDQRGARFARLATVNQDDPQAATRAFCALGAMLRPVYTPPGIVDFDDPAVRQTIVDCAMAVYSTAPKANHRGAKPALVAPAATS